MRDEQTRDDFLKFDKDSSGQVLRFRVLVKERNIVMILYNSGSEIIDLAFEEIKVDLDKIYEIKDRSVATMGAVLAKITKAPVCMMAAKDKNKLQTIVQGSVKNLPFGAE
jgi:hypothetical protein